MASTSRLNRTLQASFRIKAYGYYLGNNNYYQGESVNGNNGLYSKFIRVKVRNSDGTFELPICAPMAFYEGVNNFVKSGNNLVTSNESYEVLAPIHCNNISMPYRAATLESAFMDGYYTTPPFGVTKVVIGPSNRPSEVKATYYQAPGLILDELFRPLIYLTAVGRFTSGLVEYTELRVYVAHRVFMQSDSVTKFLLKKVVPFYLFNETLEFPFRTNSENGVDLRGWTLNYTGSRKAKVILEPLDDLVLSVKTPDNYESMEQNVYTLLKSEGAISEMFDPDKLFT